MDLNDLPLFLRVVERGSFSAVADDLGVQRSSVSRSLARLEKELGVRLLQRTTRQLALTDAGRALYDEIRGPLAKVDDALNATREFGTEPRGIVRLSSVPQSDHFNLAQIVTDFMRKYPAIRVEVVLTARAVDLVAEGFDLAIRAARLEDSSLVARNVGRTPFAIFASPSYLKRAGTPRSLADLAKHECLLFRARSGKTVWQLQGPGGAESIEVRGSLAADDLSFLVHSCAEGAGVGLLPVVLARRGVERGLLRQVFPDYFFDAGSVYVVLPTARYVPARVALFRDHLIDRLQRDLGEVNRACTKHAATRRRAPAAE